MKIFEAINEVNKKLDTLSYRIGLINSKQDDPTNKEVYQKLLDILDCAASNREFTAREEIIFDKFISL